MAEARRYAYNFAQIDVSTGFCYGVLTTSNPAYKEEAGYVEIPEYNDEYMGKYYNVANGKWYYDTAFTNEWTPA